jgi:hypothetical protein
MTRHVFTALVHRCNLPMQPLHAADMGLPQGRISCLLHNDTLLNECSASFIGLADI